MYFSTERPLDDPLRRAPTPVRTSWIVGSGNTELQEARLKRQYTSLHVLVLS